MQGHHDLGGLNDRKRDRFVESVAGDVQLLVIRRPDAFKTVVGEAVAGNGPGELGGASLRSSAAAGDLTGDGRTVALHLTSTFCFKC